MVSLLGTWAFLGDETNPKIGVILKQGLYICFLVSVYKVPC